MQNKIFQCLRCDISLCKPLSLKANNSSHNKCSNACTFSPHSLLHINSYWNNSRMLSWSCWLLNSEFHHWPHLRHYRSLNSSSLLKLIWEPITWSFGRDSLNLETVSKLILTVDLILENFCSGIHGVCMCVWNRGWI